MGTGPQAKTLLKAIQNRLSVLVYVSIIGLIVTGLLLANLSDDFNGLFKADNDYSLVLTLKHTLVIAMVGVTLIRRLGLKRLKLTDLTKERFSIRLLFTNLVLGIGVLLLSGFSAALAS